MRPVRATRATSSCRCGCKPRVSSPSSGEPRSAGLLFSRGPRLARRCSWAGSRRFHVERPGQCFGRVGRNTWAGSCVDSIRGAGHAMGAVEHDERPDVRGGYREGWRLPPYCECPSSSADILTALRDEGALARRPPARRRSGAVASAAARLRGVARLEGARSRRGWLTPLRQHRTFHVEPPRDFVPAPRWPAVDGRPRPGHPRVSAGSEAWQPRPCSTWNLNRWRAPGRTGSGPPPIAGCPNGGLCSYELRTGGEELFQSCGQGTRVAHWLPVRFHVERDAHVPPRPMRRPPVHIPGYPESQRKGI
jgi:hypothetical protein